ncbi:P-loop containing nucleoside triphosphate hydrolase protein [Lindgomyces ingoldianus]|uniref:P-loop containing nucleoside triphosphate hydrolase protein n=1 Tax=Lindgomyces ingoldianus TaxID=673940 RepID=A0ACB6Q7Q9_9PLEO|nr:P-loop containing nucleoside triphosphate hydrolase protein [Lindgomyces ingoldianus]KAF2462973.1 P-loop containing nucleoside triphosphate hydrolase protein [Lindgomyces ingoldianus]
MPGIRTKRVRDVSDDENSSQVSRASSSSSKRTRYGRDASPESVEVPNTENGYQNSSREANGEPDDDQYAEDPYQPGQLVRVKLKNFVTYTKVEFHPGPSLNMVIGPNGTGKSTLVCAICLGLGWSPQNLGRAKELGEFVKHGNTEAEIEIELAAAKHHRTNPIIRRLIKKEGNKSLFFLNGRQSTQKEVVKLCKAFSIMLDNLCQFLPQDRVVEFAGLSPVALLRETQLAAAPEHMIQWHEALKALRRDEKRLEFEQGEKTRDLKTLQAKQNATREDVERWEQRQELTRKANALGKCRPVIELNLLRNRIREVKAERDAAKQDSDQLNAEVAPLREAQADAEAYQARIDQVKASRTIQVDRAKANADKLVNAIKAQQDAVAGFTNQFAAEKDGEKKRKLDVKRLEGTIAQFERSINDEPAEVDDAEYDVRLREVRSKISSTERRNLEIVDAMKNLSQRSLELKPTLQDNVAERASLDTASGQQANKLKHLSQDAAKAWAWIEQNRESLSLKGEVCGPPILTCSVTDPSFADAVETCMAPADLTAITCTNASDHRLLSNKVFGDLGLHNVSIRQVPQPLSFYRSSLNQEELTRLGFRDWMINLVQGPDPVLAMLCESARFQRTAFTPHPLTDEQFNAASNSQVSFWIAGTQRYAIARRREYGASSIKVTGLRRSQNFTDQPVDAEEKRRLDDAIREIRIELQELKSQFDILKQEQQKLAGEIDQAKLEKEEIESEKKAKMEARVAWEQLPHKKALKEDELEGIKKLMAETRSRLLEIVAKSEEATLKVAALTLDYSKAVASLRQAHESLFEAEIRSIEGASEVDSLKTENADVTRALEEKKAAVQQLHDEHKRLRHQYNRIAPKLQEEVNALSNEERAIVLEFSEQANLEALDNEVEAVNARLLLMADGNPNAVKAYQDREQQIETCQENIDALTAEINSTKEKITTIRSKWEPELDRLVEKISDGFSHNFQKIGCAGQVSVNKDEEEFEAWSIQIQVRFRENESLSILTSQRQSGGERSVSTIFYLMALQDLARSPFRVVDEINQGMDPRNERMVHERMVDIACRERTSQYFLITPKLLNDLKFHPKMRVHCIASGENMPDQHDTLHFPSLANIALRVREQMVR